MKCSKNQLHNLQHKKYVQKQLHNFSRLLYKTHGLSRGSVKIVPQKIGPQKISPWKTAPPENCHLWKLPPMKIPAYESSPLWNFPPLKIAPLKIAHKKITPTKLTPRKLSPMKVATIVVRNWKLLPCSGGHGFRGSTDTYLIWHG